MPYFTRNGSKIGNFTISSNKSAIYDRTSLRLNPYSVFTDILLTNAGATGPVGPTLAQAQTAYAGQPWLASLAVNNGYQSYTFSIGAVFRFTVNGASGGVWTISPMDSTFAMDAPIIEGYNRLPGATVVGEYAVSEGETVTVVVGQGGGDDTNSVANNPGGGGGTFVTMGDYDSVVAGTDTLLFVAGAGAGIGYQSLDNTTGSTYEIGIGQSGTSGGSTNNEAGGLNGNGSPSLQASTNSGGGGGYLTGSGGTTTSDFSYNVSNAAAKAFRYGAKGGTFTGTDRGFGGFGGGGHGASGTESDDDKGGGGGYSGGGYGFDTSQSAGGGGSYAISGASGISITAGGNTTGRHGSVLIELV